MARKLDITKDTRDYLSSLDGKQYKQVVQKILNLTADPTPHDSIQMTGYPFRRTDIGEHRIVYRFDEHTVYIALAGKRNDDDVYKKLKRK